MPEKKLTDLFYDMLKDIYFAERQFEKPVENGEGGAFEDLTKAFLAHHDETEGQIERLKQVFEIFGKRAQAKTCEAIRGILEEGEEIIENYKDSGALDAGLLAAGQAVEHYEIARYGTRKPGHSAWAEGCGNIARPKSARRKEDGCSPQQVGRSIDQR